MKKSFADRIDTCSDTRLEKDHFDSEDNQIDQIASDELKPPNIQKMKSKRSNSNSNNETRKI